MIISKSKGNSTERLNLRETVVDGLQLTARGKTKKPTTEKETGKFNSMLLSLFFQLTLQRLVDNLLSFKAVEIFCLYFIHNGLD